MIQVKSSSFLHQQHVLIEKLENTAQEAPTEDNTGNSSLVSLYPCVMCTFLKDVDCNVDTNNCPVYVSLFSRSRSVEIQLQFVALHLEESAGGLTY